MTASPSSPSPRILRGPPLPSWLREATGETLVELFDRAVARSRDRFAVIMRDGEAVERWTYGELAGAAERVALTLARHGVGAGTRDRKSVV